MQQPVQRRADAIEALQQHPVVRAAAPSSKRGAEQPAPRVREKLHGEREGRGSERERPRAVPVYAADEKGTATSGGHRKADQARHDGAGRSTAVAGRAGKPVGKEQKSGSRYV